MVRKKQSAVEVPPPVVSADAVVASVRDQARERGVRWTAQRQRIVEVFVASDSHMTVDELVAMVRHVDPTVSPATVYRTVNLLVELKVATRRDFGAASATYECAVGKEHHHHLIDLTDGRVIEFTSDELEAVKRAIADRLGYRLVRHRLELFGVPIDHSV